MRGRTPLQHVCNRSCALPMTRPRGGCNHSFLLNRDPYFGTGNPGSPELNRRHSRHGIVRNPKVDLEAVHSVRITSGVENISGFPVHQDVNWGTGQLGGAGSEHLAGSTVTPRRACNACSAACPDHRRVKQGNRARKGHPGCRAGHCRTSAISTCGTGELSRANSSSAFDLLSVFSCKYSGIRTLERK